MDVCLRAIRGKRIGDRQPLCTAVTLGVGGGVTSNVPRGKAISQETQ